MNQLKYISSLLAIILLAPLTAEDDQKKPVSKEEVKKTSNQELLANSLKTWNQLKKNHQDSYTYTVKKSYMMGNGNTTTLHIKKGLVVKRSYSEWQAQREPVQQKPMQQWTETGKELGTHPSGSKVLTIDQIYEQAQKILKKKIGPFEKLYIKFDTQGVLKSCFTINTMIADDAPINGFTISSIKF